MRRPAEENSHSEWRHQVYVVAALKWRKWPEWLMICRMREANNIVGISSFGNYELGVNHSSTATCIDWYSLKAARNSRDIFQSLLKKSHHTLNGARLFTFFPSPTREPFSQIYTLTWINLHPHDERAKRCQDWFKKCAFEFSSRDKAESILSEHFWRQFCENFIKVDTYFLSGLFLANFVINMLRSWFKTIFIANPTLICVHFSHEALLSQLATHN